MNAPNFETDSSEGSAVENQPDSLQTLPVDQQPVQFILDSFTLTALASPDHMGEREIVLPPQVTLRCLGEITTTGRGTTKKEVVICPGGPIIVDLAEEPIIRPVDIPTQPKDKTAEVEADRGTSLPDTVPVLSEDPLAHLVSRVTLQMDQHLFDRH